MNVSVFDHGVWSAVYVNGALAHWGIAPTADQLCNLLGADVSAACLPPCFVAELRDANRRSELWRPPATLEEFRRRADAGLATELDGEIARAREMVSELEVRRAALRHADVPSNDGEGS